MLIQLLVILLPNPRLTLPEPVGGGNHSTTKMFKEVNSFLNVNIPNLTSARYKMSEITANSS